MPLPDDDLKRLKELEAQAFKAPWKPCEHGAESPYIFGAEDNPTLATLFWPAHPVEETEKAENQTYATADLICELRNKIQALLARLEASEEIAKGFEAAHPEDENCGCSMCDLLEAWRKAAGK